MCLSIGDIYTHYTNKKGIRLKNWLFCRFFFLILTLGKMDAILSLSIENCESIEVRDASVGLLWNRDWGGLKGYTAEVDYFPER